MNVVFKIWLENIDFFFRFLFVIWKEGLNKILLDFSNVYVISCRFKNCIVLKKWELISFIKLINFDN